jgi:hypothetical protein
LSLTNNGGDNRPLDGRPTQDGYTILGKRSEVLLPHIIAGVEVSVEGIAAPAAEEDRLRTAIGTMLIATARTRLRGMPGINRDHTDATLLRLVDGESMQLGKRPTMQPPFVSNVLVPFASAHPGGLTNMREVLEDEGTARVGILNEVFREDVICIPVETRLPLAELFQVAFGRLRSVGLQFATKTEMPAIHHFPVRGAKELTSRGHSRAVQAQVNPDDYLRRDESRFGDSNNNVQPPLPVAQKQFSRCHRIACILLAPAGNGKGQADFATIGGQANFLGAPVKGKGLCIISGRAEQALRHLDGFECRDGFPLFSGPGDPLLIGGLVFLLPREGALESFRRLDASLDEQIGDQPRTGRFGLIVGGVVQPDPVLLAVLPAVATHGIEGIGKLGKRLTQEYRLLRGWMQLETHGSVHTFLFYLFARKPGIDGDVW